MSRTKGIRIQPVIPAPIYEQLMKHVEDTGFTISQIVANLIHAQTPKLRDEPQAAPKPEKPTDLVKREKFLLDEIKRIVPKVSAFTDDPYNNSLARSEIVRLQTLMEERNQVNVQLERPEISWPNKVDWFDAARKEVEEILAAQKAELEDLSMRMRRGENLDYNDERRVKELVVYIPQTERELANYII